MSMCIFQDGQGQLSLPLIDVEILRQICRQASCRRRASNWFEVEVIDRGFVHTQVSEIESAWAEVELPSTVSKIGESVSSLIPAPPLSRR